VTTLTAVAAGIDTLYLSIRGEPDGLTLQTIRALRDSSDDDATAFTLDERDGYLVLRPHGWRGYPLWLSSPRYELMVGASPPFPAAYVQLHSAYIHTLGVEDAVASVTDVLSRWLFPNGMAVVPSRIDVYADVQGWEPTHDDYRRFTCRAVGRRQYDEPSEMHSGGRRLTGFTFGRGDVVARVYNKTVELRRRGQTWPMAVWTDPDPEVPVWRVEFQYRRKALTSFRLRTVADVLAARQELWEYGTRWLSLRTPTADRVQAHWPVASEWEALRQVEIATPRSELVRERVHGADELRLLRGLGGYISALAAAWNEKDMDAAWRIASPRLRHYFAERGVGFAQLVRIKRSRRPAL